MSKQALATITDLPLRRTLTRSEHVGIRVDSETKAALDHLRSQGVSVSEWLYRVVRQALQELKDHGVTLK